MAVLGVFAAAGFRRWSAYRLATLAGAFTNSVFGLIKAGITVAAIGAAGGTLAGYTARAGSSYTWWTQALLGPVFVFTWNELALRIRTGDVAVDLARPVDLQLQLLAGDLGRAAFQLIPRGLPPLLVGALTFGLGTPGPFWNYPLAVVSVLAAVVVSFGCRFLVNLAAFWLVEVRGLINTYVVVSNLLCGLFVPVHWFPGWLLAVALATPFPSMIQAPVDVLTGQVTGLAAAGTVGLQIAWAAVLLGVGRLVLRLAERRLVVQGG